MTKDILLVYYTTQNGRALRKPIRVSNPKKIEWYQELKRRNGLSWLELSLIKSPSEEVKK